jgi:hypothetical protein
VKVKPLVIGALFVIKTIAPACEPRLEQGEPEHTEQSQTQQESAQLEADSLMDALTMNTHSGTAPTLGDWAARYPGPKDFL